MILYLDTSALVKLYIEESGSQEVAHAVEEAQIVSTSRVAYVEARAGIARKCREGDLSKKEHNYVVEALIGDWDRYFIIEVSENVTKLGGALTEKQSLRGFDAIHLASALLLRNRTRLDVSFSCFDERLKTAAVAEGLMVNGNSSKVPWEPNALERVPLRMARRPFSGIGSPKLYVNGEA